MLDDNSLNLPLAAYFNLGFALVPIPSGQKAPTALGWQKHPVLTFEEAQQHGLGTTDSNIGLHHGMSGTAVLDIDHSEYAELAFAALGIDLKTLLSAPGCKIQTPKGLKPVYRLPKSVTLTRKALAWRSPDGKSISVFELRSGATQDLLPPRYILVGYATNGRPKPHGDLKIFPSFLKVF